MAGDGSSIKETSIIMKAVQTDTASDATVNNDPELLFAIAANEKIIIKANLVYVADAGGIRMTFNGPAGFSLIDYHFTILPNGGVITTNGSSAAWGTEVVLAGISVGRISAVLHLNNGVNGGNINLQWAQQASNVNNTSLYKSSSMIMYRY